MARLSLISLYDRNAHGLRLMSALLEQHGHCCDLVFLKAYTKESGPDFELLEGELPFVGIGRDGRPFKYASGAPITEPELALLLDLLARLRPDAVGLSVNAPLRAHAAQVTRRIRERLGVPVLWGGLDPTADPAGCLACCDFACVGEGDRAILEVAAALDSGRSLEAVANLAFLRGGELVRNPPAPLVDDLDALPWRDDDPEGQYLIDGDRLVERPHEVNDKPEGVYQTMSSRGCPYACAFCCESALKALYAGQRFLRRRSPERLVAELAAAQLRFGITRFEFEDEIFAIDGAWLDDFLPRYRREIGVPFTAYVFPGRDTSAMLERLSAAGMDFCCLALQSGSARIHQEVFGRPYDAERFLGAVRACKRLGIGFYTDVISYNPYEQEEDLRATLEMLQAMGGGFGLCLNRLYLAPGTALTERVEREGLGRSVAGRADLFDRYARLFWAAAGGER